MDYNFVTERLATGAAITDHDDVQVLLDAGITGIIDCRGEENDVSLLASNPNIHYIYLGVPDDGQPKPVSWFESGIEFALDLLSRPHNKVFSHCAAGVNRGPSMCMAILMAQGIRSDKAENMIRAARPQVGLAYKVDALRAVQQLGYQDSVTSSSFGEIER